MMRHKKTSKTLRFLCTLFFIPLALLCQFANAEPVPAFDASEILTTSDLVANVQPLQVVGRCRVLSVLLGRGAVPGSTITISTQDPKLLLALKNKQCICVFLKSISSSSTTFASSNSYYTWFHVGPKLTRREPLGRSAIEAQLLADLSSKDEAAVNDAVIWLNYFDSAKGKQEISILAQLSHPSPPVYAAYLIQEIPKGDPNIIRNALNFIGINGKDSFISDWFWRIAYAFSRIRSTRDVPYLNHLLVQQSGDTSRWLISSARYWSDKSSVPYLMQALTQFDMQRLHLANNAESGKLDEAIEKEQDCISALSTVTRRPGPGSDAFEKTPDKYYIDWQEWWKTVGHTKYGDIDTN